MKKSSNMPAWLRKALHLQEKNVNEYAPVLWVGLEINK
jgi:hypothetical protein